MGKKKDELVNGWTLKCVHLGIPPHTSPVSSSRHSLSSHSQKTPVTKLLLSLSSHTQLPQWQEPITNRWTILSSWEKAKLVFVIYREDR